MSARDIDAMKLKSWKQLISQHCSQRTPLELAAPSSGDHQHQVTFLDWSEQPPRKKTKRLQTAATPRPQPRPLQEPSGGAGFSGGGQSHKVVEKRRRDRMNQALSSLSRLIPASYLRQGQSKVEKAEIIELATQHLMALTWQLRKSNAALGHDISSTNEQEDDCCIGKFYLGFCEGSKSALSFLTDQEGFSTTDTLCYRLRAHLHSLSQRHLPELSETADPSKCQQQKQKQQASAPGYGSCSSSDEAPASCGSCGSSGDEVVDGVGGACKPIVSKFLEESEARSSVAPQGDDEQMLPGFVLHESGTYYLPLVVPPSALGTEFCRTAGPDGISPSPTPQVGEGTGKKRKLQEPLLHPVSIPVNFHVTRFVAAQQRKS